MTLAAILAIYVLSLAANPLSGPTARPLAVLRARQASTASPSNASGSQDQSDASATQSQPPEKTTEPAPPKPSSTDQAPNSATGAKPTSTHRRHHRKTSVPDCSTAPTALKPPAAVDPAAPGQTASTQTVSTEPAPGNANSAPLKPCPPPLKVVRNGGSNEPTVQLNAGRTPEQAIHQLSTTEQFANAAEENLRKIDGRELSSSQKEMVSQIKQYMEQSKAAVAAGDLERGRNLAMKAQLLSNELVKP